MLTLILIALAITLAPLSLTAFLVVLASERGARKGAAYVFGWLASMAVVVTVTILATRDNPPRPDTIPSLASLAIRLAIGVFLVIVGIRRERRRGQPKQPKKQPKWQAQVDSMSPWFAMGLAPTLQPWTLTAAGAATIVQAEWSHPASFLALFFYCVLASSSYLIMETYAVVRPAESQAFLAKLRAWMNGHTDQVIIIGSMSLGLWLIANSCYLIITA
jgi:hypothetical protein